MSQFIFVVKIKTCKLKFSHITFSLISGVRRFWCGVKMSPPITQILLHSINDKEERIVTYNFHQRGRFTFFYVSFIESHFFRSFFSFIIVDEEDCGWNFPFLAFLYAIDYFSTFDCVDDNNSSWQARVKSKNQHRSQRIDIC